MSATVFVWSPNDDVVILNVSGDQFSPLWHIMKIPGFLYGYINLYLVNVYWLLFAIRPRFRMLLLLLWPWTLEFGIFATCFNDAKR